MFAHLRVFSTKTGKEVKPGATVTDFRGDKAKLLYPLRANMTGHEGKVLVHRPGTSWNDERYAGVFDLEVR